MPSPEGKCSDVFLPEENQIDVRVEGNKLIVTFRVVVPAVLAGDTGGVESPEESPVVRMVNVLLTQAMEEGALVAVVPTERRTDWKILREVTLAKTPKFAHGLVVARIKIMAGLQVGVHGQPQCGSFVFQGRRVDVKVIPSPETGEGDERMELRFGETVGERETPG